MNILVTGGTGFLGQHLAHRLSKMGHTVTILGRNREIGAKMEAQGIQFVCAELSDRDAVIAACQNQSVVFHCGALSAPWGKAQAFYKANVLGTRHVIQGCQKFGIHRLTHVSTPSIYFAQQDRLNISEDEPLPVGSINNYANTKRRAEEEIDRAFQDGLSVITIRPRAIFGPGDRTILPRLIRANQRLGIPFINQGQALIDVTYVDNVVDALICCLDSPDTTLGKKYNISNGTPVTLAELLESLFPQLGQKLKPIPIPYPLAYGLASIMEKLVVFDQEPLLTCYSVGVLAKSQTLDISRAKNELGYHPAVSVAEGLERFATWWKEHANAH